MPKISALLGFVIHLFQLEFELLCQKLSKFTIFNFVDSVFKQNHDFLRKIQIVEIFLALKIHKNHQLFAQKFKFTILKFTEKIEFSDMI